MAIQDQQEEFQAIKKHKEDLQKEKESLKSEWEKSKARISALEEESSHPRQANEASKKKEGECDSIRIKLHARDEEVADSRSKNAALRRVCQDKEDALLLARTEARKQKAHMNDLEQKSAQLESTREKEQVSAADRLNKANSEWAEKVEDKEKEC
ncbi:hypothetical protein IAT40_007231 [Kwoniella sp. CBS 6097]